MTGSRTRTTPEVLEDAISRVQNSSDGTRGHAIAAALDVLVMDVRAWVRAISRSFGDPYMSHYEDVVNVAMEELFKILGAIDSSTPHPQKDWYRYLYVCVFTRVRLYYLGPEFSGLAEATQQKIRTRRAESVRGRLRMTLGREPSTSEIVDAANRDLLERRSNPAKSGDLIAPGDVQRSFDILTIDLFDLATVMHWDEPSTIELDRTEARALARLIVEECERIDPKLGEVAKEWVSMVQDPIGKAKPSELAEATDSTPQDVYQSVSRVRRVARRILSDMGYPTATPTRSSNSADI